MRVGRGGEDRIVQQIFPGTRKFAPRKDLHRLRLAELGGADDKCRIADRKIG